MTRARRIEAVIAEWLRGSDFEYDTEHGKAHASIGVTLNDVEIEGTTIDLNIQSLAEHLDAEFDRIARETVA